MNGSTHGPGRADEISAARLALLMVEPDRPHNFGGALRLAACLGFELHLVEPCGFPLSDRRIREGALDYARAAAWFRHPGFAHFEAAPTIAGRRLVLLTTGGDAPFTTMRFQPGDIVAVGSESRGAPDWLHARAHQRVRIPMQPGMRSLNVLTAATIVLTEALRQTGGFGAIV